MKAIHTPTGQVVEARQWKGDNFKDLWNLANGQVQQLKGGTLGLSIKGSFWPVSVGEYVIKTIDGKLHVHSARYFDGHYTSECQTPVDETPMK